MSGGTPRRIQRGLVAAGAVLAVLGGAAPLRAQNVKELCATAYDQSQELRDEQKLLLARTQLLVCENACPAVLARDCTKWRADVDARLPTALPSARDAQGRTVDDAQVRIDGKPAVELKEIQLDVGRHTFRFERPDGSSVEVDAVLDERARAVPVLGVFPGAATAGGDATAKTVSGGPPLVTYVLGGVGLAALGVAGVLAIKGHVDRGALYDCRPSCPQGDVDAVATTWTVAGVIAGVGAVEVGVAILLWVTSDGAQGKASGHARRRAPPLGWTF